MFGSENFSLKVTRTDPERTPNGSQTNPERIPIRARTEPERIPNGPQTDPERTPNGPSASQILCEMLLHAVGLTPSHLHLLFAAKETQGLKRLMDYTMCMRVKAWSETFQMWLQPQM